MEQMSTDLHRKCGENVQLAIDAALTTVRSGKNLMFSHGDSILRQQILSGSTLMFVQPLLDWLQIGFAECHCSPFGRLHVLNQTGSGSLAEQLTGMLDGPTLQATSDSDLMIELGPGALGHGLSRKTDTRSGPEQAEQRH